MCRLIAALLIVCGTTKAHPELHTIAPDLTRYEGRLIQSVEVRIEGAATDSAMVSELRTLLRLGPDMKFSAVLVRESLQSLFDSGRIADARVEAFDASGRNGEDGRAPVGLRFIIRPQVRVAEVVLDLGVTTGTPVSEDELRARLNMLEPGARVSPRVLENNADLIQSYLRDRGFYQAEVDFTQQLDPSGMRATVVYRVLVGEPARVDKFDIRITGFNPSAISLDLKNRSGAAFTRTALGEDINTIRQAIIAEGYLAPQLDEPEIRRDASRNTIDLVLKGAVGPKVDVSIKGYELSEEKARALLPVKREGSIDQSAIEEGRRRLLNRLQERGYFFPEVTPVCTVNPPTPTVIGVNGVAQTCENLNPAELSGRTVNLTYEVDPGRRFKLTDIRIEGTEKLSFEDVEADLRSQEANALGFIPLLGYGRGNTSRELLERDRRTIRARMRDLGYRRAEVTARQGVSVDGEKLIITFVVDEGPLTRVAGAETRGNKIYTADRLRNVLRNTVIGGPFSLSAARADADRMRNLYARNGYLDADVQVSVIELPRKKDGDEQVRLLYTLTEGEKVFINRIFVNGNVRTEKEAILRSIPLREGDVLRADQLAESERILYSTNAFRQVIIRPEAAGETAGGFRKRDVIIDVEELKPRVLDYGGGFSTDNGPLGLFDLRNNNLFGKLRQGGVRGRASGRQQLLRLEYFDPRFQRYGRNAFAPLVASLQYQRDTSVTRFFRSTIDRGNFGIVQRLDEEGKPIDEFGQRTGAPTINRFTFNLETQRDLELSLGPGGAVQKRSTLFLRYNYEDVRLFNIGSLLIAPVLRPDRSVRLSRLGATFARDTRDRQFDPTRGEFLTLDYSLALRQLGGNLSFNKFQTTYRRYYKLGQARGGTILAGGLQLGLAHLFNPRDRNENGVIDDIDRTLPISERFFSGGSTTLRGFGFEEAGPRVVVPGGVFRNNQGEPVTIDPFTVPIGGNALAVVNLEARVPLTKSFQLVPFYDGGNVFRRVGDIFGRERRADEDPNLRARWTHTVGLGLRLKTPFGPLAIDYGYLLNPPEFFVPQGTADPARIRLKRGQLHFRFGQTF